MLSFPDDLDFGQTIQIPRFGVGQKIFRRYTLQKILGRGGMGVVWLARDEQLETLVALKVLPETLSHDRVSLHDLKRETKLGLHLAHPNIVRIYDFQQDDDAAAISMEYVDGATLSEVRITKPKQIFNPADLCPYIEALCDALHYAHSRVKIVHRDLKPRNLMLDREGELKIADFGISRSISESMTMITGKLGSAGTPPYISPQQWDGDSPTPVDDIYSVGATLYELLTSKPPFLGVVDWQQVHEKVPPPISKRRADLGIEGAVPIPREWEETIAACLAKNPKDRPQTVRELQRRLTINGQMPVTIAETKAPPAVNFTPEVAETVESSEEDFFADVTLKDLPEATVDTATARAEPKLDATTAPIKDASSPVSEVIVNKLGSILAEVVPKDISKVASKISEPAADAEAPAARLIEEQPLPPSTRALRLADPVLSLPLERAAPTNGGAPFPSTVIQSPDRPEASPSLRRVPRWVWAVAAAAVLLLCGIFIWRKPSPPEPTRSPFADLLIESEPSGADLTLDGGPPIKTPHTFKDLKFGPHRLTMTLQGYSPIERDIEFSGASLPKIVLERRPKPLEEIAKLSVRSDPPGASIRLDGTLPQEPNTFRNVKFGEHRLTAAMEGFEPKEQPLVVSRDTSSEIILKLDHAPRPKPLEEIAKLSVRSDPPGASIRLDGTLPQEPPNTFTNVKFGEHKITAALEGYEPKEQVLPVHGGISNEIVLKLDRAQPTPAQDPLQALITERNDYETARDWPKYRTISLELVRRLTTAGEPASKEHRDLLASVIEGIRTKGNGLSSEEFRAYEENLKYAAKLDLVPAILVLADNLRQRKSPDAFNWYYYAAETKHVAPAMTKLGWLYWLGECGQEADKEQALKWFKLAHAAGETNAGVIVGKCYLRGDGIAKDEDEAIRILLPLAEAGVADAKTLIGECYYYGLGQFAKLTQKQRDQMAKTFFEEAVAAGDWEACGHLGVMYEVGQGVPKDWKQAARLYLQGVEHENPVCMFYYARAIENHGADLMKMLDRQDKAETYYAKAAAASITEARKWCIEHDVKF